MQVTAYRLHHEQYRAIPFGDLAQKISKFKGLQFGVGFIFVFKLKSKFQIILMDLESVDICVQYFIFTWHSNAKRMTTFGLDLHEWLLQKQLKQETNSKRNVATYGKYLVSVMVILFWLLPAMQYIQNILIGVGIAQNSHSMLFCQLRGTDNSKREWTWWGNMEK